ncbi:SDR family NAD(P)-dependent oxidoreductase [Sphingopyxis sp. FD7]|uniref:SDR family NAD(P)-dependent oxidoreductase n=1 Tax=Sphingopyxis sp. FD7 TaxID=1914525 RepID=UPI000DC61DC2|nr:SDR family NAD(P)-dependent oxidoreductase [Sphingopyxis sp. FD7]BBB14402.1 3-oxoacyl-ACP reductase [Sphingopyxis sp. FD7]
MNPRIAVVTGAARGIGASTAVRLAQQGRDVALIDLDESACADTAAAVTACGARALAIGCDVTDEGSVSAAVALINGRLGPPAILVNNAGLFRETSFARLEPDDWDQLLAANLRSVYLMVRAVEPYMREARWGRIVNLSSTAALGGHGQANYAAAKAGVQGLTRALSSDLGRLGVTINAVAPGFVVSAMTEDVARRTGQPLDQLIAREAQTTAVGRVGTPDDIANAIAFFTDERSGFVTGQVLYVAGGPRG